MSEKPSPLDGRPDLRVDHDPDHPLTRALRELVLKHRLTGAVLLTFSADRCGVNSSSPDPAFCNVMTELGDLILAKLDDGGFDGALLAIGGVKGTEARA